MKEINCFVIIVNCFVVFCNIPQGDPISVHQISQKVLTFLKNV